MPTPPSLVWLRLDLRLEDNPALAAAAERGPVVPIFVWAPEEEAPWAPGAASRWWLHGSLASMARALADDGSRLVLRRGPTLAALRQLAVETGAAAVFWNRRCEPAVAARDAEVEQALLADGLVARSFNAGLLWEPQEVATRNGRPFRVFTPFWRACLAQPAPAGPIPRPVLGVPPRWPESLPLAALRLEPRIDWAAGLRHSWRPGEGAAMAALERFREGALGSYAGGRDRPDRPGTSRLSPHLHFGEIGPRQVWHALVGRPGAEAYLRQLGWREFAHHLLGHFPHTPEEPLRPEFAAFPWEHDPAGLGVWQRGETGYPLVDAGMRELWQTGWMHNRARMVTASFLVKDLLLSWQEGARWFWETLVDADLANNTLGWQWAAGCGADAAPFFRIFNPIVQGRRFDPEEAYARRFVPELAEIPAGRAHEPYGRPLVDHGEARRRALEALAQASL